MTRGEWAKEAQRKELMGQWADMARTPASKPARAMRIKGRTKSW